MSGRENKAVFLSYASQDAEAAKRIADALRAAGVEVWFDAEGGLEHGDAWDAKIRRQIKECVLFIPLISANTQARDEGYFRIEWELAAQRALGIATGVAFILPVLIDGTKEADALVPDRFRTVQWTKLPGGVVSPEVLQRFLKLWSHRTGALKHQVRKSENVGGVFPSALGSATAEHPDGSEESGYKIPTTKTKGRGLWIAAAVLVVLIAGAFGQRYLQRTSPSAATARSEPATDFPRDPELQRARSLIFSLNAIPEDFLLAEDMLKPVLAQRPNDPEVATVAAEINQEFLSRGFDSSPARRAQVQRLAERAVQLAPDNPYALGTMSRYLLFIGGQLARAEELIRKALTLRPDEARFHRTLHYILFLTRSADETDAYGERMAAQFPRDPLVAYDIARRFKDANDLEQMEKWFDRTLERDPAVAFAMIWKAWLALRAHGNLDGMKQWLDRVPERQRNNTRVVNARYVHALHSGDTRAAILALNQVADEWLTDFDLSLPKTLLAGNLALLEGRNDLARAQFEAALAIVGTVLEKTPNDGRPQRARMWALIGLGRMEEARALQRIFLQSLNRPYLTDITRATWANPIISCLLLDLRADAISLLRDSSGDANCRRILRHMFRLDPRLKPWRDDPEINALLAEPAPARAVSALVLQGREMLEKFVTDDTQSAALSLAEELAKRALQENPADADAWSLSAQISSSFFVSGRDHLPARRAAINSAAERAMQLAPQSDESIYARAVAYRLEATTKDEAERLMRELVQRNPGDRRMLRMLGNVVRNRQAYAEALAIYRQAAALPGGDARAELACAEMFDQLGRREEAAAATDRSLAVQPTGAAYLFKVNLARVRGDLAAAQAELAKVPPAVLLDVRGASVAANVWLWSREPEKMIAVLNAVPGDDLYNSYFYGPKSLLLGFAHQLAGRNEVAKLQWRIALRNLEQRAEADPFVAMEPLFMGLRMFLGFLIGDPAMKTEARQMLRLYLQLGNPVEIDPTWDMTKLFSLLGMQDTIIDFCEEMLRSGDWPGLREIMRTRRDFAPLRGNPRFDALLKEPEVKTK